MTIDSNTNLLRVKFSLRYKILLGFFLVFSAAFAFAYYWFWQYSTNTAMGRIEQDLADTLHGTILGIDGDEFEALVKEGIPDESGLPSQDPRYIAHQDWLMSVYEIEPRAYNTYTFVKGNGPDEVLWIGDNYRDILPDQENTRFLESYTRTPESWIMRGFEKEVVNPNLYSDPWGEHLSAYGPIKNSRNSVVGAVGIDFRAEYVLQVQAGIRRTMLISLFVAYVALFILVYLMSSLMTNPIIKLARAAELVGEGDYQQDFSVMVKTRLVDEINVLASSFAVMVSKVYHREQILRRQVEELKIEIDETKRRRQVDEIVDTDFFRDLQAKADRMRSRRGGQQSTKLSGDG
jgi:HAMP domain-containing protein